jgi:tetratricopeptide (TPR) repeat protein
VHSIPLEIALPKNETDFERMCAQVYGVVFKDPNPKMNGRRGQKQGGVDVFVKSADIGRIGIQCKKYTLKPVKWGDVLDEVAKADEFKTPIKQLLLATTALSDTALLHKVQLLSDEREAKGLFTVEIEFWEDISNHIDTYVVLQDHYAPHTPGAAYYRQDQQLNKIAAMLVETKAAVLHGNELPPARLDSVDKLISSQLDHINNLLKVCKYRDALVQLAAIGKDFAPFDAHQQARWYLQRGLALWLSRDDSKEAAEHFLKAFSLYPDDERFAAAQVRGLMLQGQLDEALAAGAKAAERFPLSQQVWLILANVRMIKGESLVFDDVPNHLRAEPDVLQLAAMSAQSAGKFEEASRYSFLAVEHADAGFFIRAATLRLAVEWAAKQPIGAMYGVLPTAELEALESAVRLFEPRLERLWIIQSDAVSETASHLGYALLLQRRFQEALNLAIEAEANGIKTPELLRTRVCALSDLQRFDELLALGQERLAEFNAEALVALGELAASKGAVDLLAKAAETARALTPVHAETVEILTALRWEALNRAGAGDIAVQEILAGDIARQGSFITACVAARVLKGAGRAMEAEAVVDRARALVTVDSSESDQLMLAELLYHTHQWAEAATWYARLLAPGKLSDLHNRLLACYVRSHNRRKAKDLLSSLPLDWIENDDTRSLAIDLGQQAGDWTFLQPLAETQVRKAPHLAKSWLFKLFVALHASPPAQFQADLRGIPESLDGSVRTLSQLSSLELRYGEVQRGLRRLYRTARLNFDVAEALSAYFLTITMTPAELPLMDKDLATVVPGSAVTLVDEMGQTYQVVIDPVHVPDAPEREGFYSPTSVNAAALLGAVPGQLVDMPTQALGGVRRFRVAAIQSAYLRMMQLVQERAHSLSGLPNMKSVPIGTSGDVEKDFAYLLAELKKSNEHSKGLMDHYARGALTLGGLAHFKTRSSIDTVVGWPSDGTPLFTAHGTAQERQDAFELLARQDATYVIDSATLAELVSLDIQDLLATLPKLLITPVTHEILKERLAEEADRRESATSAEVDGQLAVIKLEKEHRQKRTEFAKAMLAAVDKYCKVQPAYGELTEGGDFQELADVLKQEELELLLLAQANNATLLVLDGRLRVLLKQTHQLPGIWPQALLMYGSQLGIINSNRCAKATAQMFLSNRNFVALSARDLIWMIFQGGSYLQRGVQRFKQNLASGDADFKSTLLMTLEFLDQISRLQIQLGAFGELLVHLVEAILRHKLCPPEFLQNVWDFLDRMTEELAHASLAYPPANAIRVQRMNLQRHFLAEKLEEARALAEQPQIDRPVAIRVLYCTKLPKVLLNTKVCEIAPSVESVGLSAPLRIESQVQSESPSENKKTETAYSVSALPAHGG